MANFLPEDHKEPKARSRYTKLEDGDNTLRILTSPVMGYEYWAGEKEDRKPVRVRTADEVPTEVRQARDSRERDKRFWMMAVLNKDTGTVQIFEATQASVRDGIFSLSKNKIWGDPRDFDLIINKSGSQKNTRYQVSPCPKEKLSKDLQKMVDDEVANIDLEKVFDGESPFLTKE